VKPHRRAETISPADIRDRAIRQLPSEEQREIFDVDYQPPEPETLLQKAYRGQPPRDRRTLSAVAALVAKKAGIA